MIEVLLSFVGSKVVKSLMTGRAPDADTWASLVGEVLGVVVAQEARTNENLRRIEEKLDHLAVQNYQQAMGTGFEVLAAAQRAWRTPQDLDRLLDDARREFLRAAAAAPDELTRARARTLLALIWLLMGSLNDTKAELAEAADLWIPAVNASTGLEVGEEWAIKAAVVSALTPIERLSNFFNESVATDKLHAITTELCNTRLERRNVAMEELRAIQQVRRQLGVVGLRAPIPRLPVAGEPARPRIVWETESMMHKLTSQR